MAKKMFWKIVFGVCALFAGLFTLFLVAAAIGTQDSLLRAGFGLWHLTIMVILNAMTPALGAVPAVYFIQKFRGRW